jgi:hypothetical protein
MAASVLLDTNLLILYAVGLASPDYIVRHRRLAIYRGFGRKAFELLTERLSTTSMLLRRRRQEFARLGLADAVTIDAIGSGAVLVTDDAPLYDAALRAGGQAELFSHHLVAAGLR